MSHRDADEFKDVLLTNVLGPFLVTKALLPVIKMGNKKQVIIQRPLADINLIAA